MATKSVTLEIMDGYGQWSDETGDGKTYGLMSADAHVGYRDMLIHQGLAAPGDMTLVMNNSAQRYTPPQDAPGLSSILRKWRRVRVRVKTQSLGNCLRMMSSGMGAPGTSLNANTGNAGTVPISGGPANFTTSRAQAFVTTGGVITGITFATPSAGVTVTWTVYADSGGLPGAVLHTGSVSAVNGTNTVTINSGTFHASGTVLWVALVGPSGTAASIYTSNGATTYAPGQAWFNHDVTGFAADGWKVNTGNYQFSLTMAPQGTSITQTVNQSGVANDVLAFTLDHRAQWDTQYNTLAVQIITNAENGPVTTITQTNKYKTQTISFTATQNYTSITITVWACHNHSMISSVYSEIRNCTLTKNAGANLLTNGNFATGSLSPWTETSQADIALFGKENYDTDVQLRAAAHAGGSASQTTTPNTTVVGANGANNQQAAQTFQVTDGQLNQVQLYFGASTGNPVGTATCEVWSTSVSTVGIGYVAAKKLASAIFTPLPSQINNIQIVNGPLLAASTEYMIVVYSTAVQATGNAWNIQNSSSDVYANGKLGTANGNGGVGPTIVAFPGQITWTDTGFDMAFSVTTVAVPIKDKLVQSFVVFTSQPTASLKLWMNKVGAPVGTMTARVETDSAGQPSGTLADANATATVAESSLSTSYGWITFTWAGAFTLTTKTKYWLVLSTTRASSGTNYVNWGTDASSPVYLSGDGVMLYNSSSAYSAENKVAIHDLIASAYSSLSVVDDTEIQYNGFVQKITPSAHKYGDLRCTIKCLDWLQLFTTTPFNLALQANQDENQLISKILGSLPANTLTTTPVGTLLDPGTDVMAYAFDGYVQNKTNNNPGSTTLFATGIHEIVRPVQNNLMLQQALDDVLKSCQGRFWQDPDGTLRFANRNQTPALQSVAPVLTVVEGSSAVKLVADTQEQLINRVFCNYHPRQVGTGNVVLGQLNIPPNVDISQWEIKPRQFDVRTGAVIPGKLQQTITFHDSAGKPIGATSIATPVADTDFIFQSTQWGVQPAGSQWDITQSKYWPTPWAGLVTFSYTYTASQAVVTFYNWSAHPIFIAKFQLQGIPLYTLDPVTLEAFSSSIVGPSNLDFNEPLTLDLPFATYAERINSLATYTLNRYKNPYLRGTTLNFKNKDTVAGQDVWRTNLFDVVLVPDTQAGLTSAARHFVVGKQWTYSVGAGGVLDSMVYPLERCDPNLYCKFNDPVTGFYDQGYMYFI